MTQYCRYCTNMCCGDENFCAVRLKTYSDAYIKRANKCRDFVFCPIDALGENPKGYKPRKSKADDGEQTIALIVGRMLSEEEQFRWLWEMENAKKKDGE